MTLRSKWQKIKDKCKYLRVAFVNGNTFTIISILFLFWIFWRDYVVILNSNKESLYLACPFLISFLWFAWRNYRRNNNLNLNILLTAVGVFLAAWIFIFQTTTNNTSKITLIKNANTHNCELSEIAVAESPIHGPVLSPFIIGPYLDNPDIVYKMYGNTGGSQVMQSIFNLQGWNRTSNIIDGLYAQDSDPSKKAYIDSQISKYNTFLIRLANNFKDNVCNLPFQQSWLVKIFSQTKSFFIPDTNLQKAPAPRVGLFIGISDSSDNRIATVYYVGKGVLLAIPDLKTFKSWGYDFNQVVPANEAEKRLPVSGIIPMKAESFKNPLEQIESMDTINLPVETK